MENSSKWIAIGALVMALGVMTGAFGAHGLRDKLSPALMQVWEKAVLYHFVHGFMLLGVPLLSILQLLSKNSAATIYLLFAGGIAIFSGSLYLLCLLDKRWLGAITPIGGTLFIIAWLTLAFKLWQTTKSPT